MKSLHGSGAFSSLTYRDMPFVLAPNLWSKIHGSPTAHAQAEERAHGDGILIDIDSPEALEEVFWRVQLQGGYIHEDGLACVPVPDSVIENFRHYISLILLKYGKDRYLSKNNNNILRFPALLDAFPKAKIIVPFRHPQPHAVSLSRLHQSFIGQHQQDPFLRKYMKWLVHHEFGLLHKPFIWANYKTEHHNQNVLEYWLAQWFCVYQHVLELKNKFGAQILLFDYDRFCDDPDNYFDKLASAIGIPNQNKEIIRKNPPVKDEFTDKELLSKALECHQGLKKKAL